MLLESHLRLTMSVLYCISFDVLRLAGAPPMTEPSITTEQCPGHHLQTPQVFLRTSGSHLCRNFFGDQPNDAEVDMATPRRLYTCRITYYSTFMSIHYVYFGSMEKHSDRKFSYGTLLFNYSCILLKGMKQKSTWTYFSKKCMNNWIVECHWKIPYCYLFPLNQNNPNGSTWMYSNKWCDKCTTSL